MLVLNGTAEWKEDSGKFEKGKRYAFNMFSTDQTLNDVIEDVAIFLGDLGWNEIDVKNTKLISRTTEIKDPVLKEAFEYALENRFAVVYYHDPVEEALKL